MKKLLLAALAAGLACTAVPALAQNAPAPPNPAMRQQFKQIRTQMRAIHQTERAKMLAALTPAHKQLLASVVGQLAIAQTPNRRAAAAQLDSALSATERAQILSIAQNTRSQMQALMKNLPRPQGMERSERGPRNFRKHAPDPGMMLLHLSAAGPPHRF